MENKSETGNTSSNTGYSSVIARILTAQNAVYEEVLMELKSGLKQTHWMWYIFPQISGLGFSENSQRFAIPNLETAVEYLSHPVLSHRLLQCCDILLQHDNKEINDILGEVDAIKLKSSMSLFAIATSENRIFSKVLEVFFAGAIDQRTAELVKCVQSKRSK